MVTHNFVTLGKSSDFICNNRVSLKDRCCRWDSQLNGHSRWWLRPLSMPRFFYFLICLPEIRIHSPYWCFQEQMATEQSTQSSPNFRQAIAAKTATPSSNVHLLLLSGVKAQIFTGFKAVQLQMTIPGLPGHWALWLSSAWWHVSQKWDV